MDTILVLLPESARLYSESLAGIRRRLGGDYREQIIDYDIDAPTLRKVLAFWQPLGCIIFGWKGVESVQARELTRIPTVYLDHRQPLSKRESLVVIQDYAECGRIAARELIRNDCLDYAFVGDCDGSYWSDERGQAFAEAVHLHGRTCRIYGNHNHSRADAKALERWLLNLPKPTSLFAANDLRAREILNIAALNGLRVPDDLAVLGVDNIRSICESTQPSLSSIITDFERGGWEAADLLCARIKSPSLHTVCRRYGVLGVIHRGSTKTIPNAAGHTSKTLRALHFIQSRAADGLSVEDVASEMGCSRRLAEIRFRKATGKTIKSAITDVRLERAKILVKNRAMPLKAIAAACGYHTVNALRVAFRNRFGTSLRNDGTHRVP